MSDLDPQSHSYNLHILRADELLTWSSTIEF